MTPIEDLQTRLQEYVRKHGSSIKRVREWQDAVSELCDDVITWFEPITSADLGRVLKSPTTDHCPSIPLTFETFRLCLRLNNFEEFEFIPVFTREWVEVHVRDVCQTRIKRVRGKWRVSLQEGHGDLTEDSLADLLCRIKCRM